MSSTCVSLGDATDFAVLAGSTVTNTGPTVIVGDVGLQPGSAVIGFPPGLIHGSLHVDDGAALNAQTAVTNVVNELRSMPSTTLTGDLSTVGSPPGTLTAGVYSYSSSAGLTGTLTLNAQGDPNALFVFLIGSSLTTASASNVVLENEANFCNVFWVVGSSATLGTNSTFMGNILAQASITLTTGATLNGRALAQIGAVTLDDNQINMAQCSPSNCSGPTPPIPTPQAGSKCAQQSAFDYTGVTQTYVVPHGIERVQIELWGANGGADTPVNIGYGGYAKGVINVKSGSTLYVYPGSAGKAFGSGGDGFNLVNGGTGGSNVQANAAGGGAGSFVTLSSASAPITQALAVAGGGGGSSQSVVAGVITKWRGGYGGGTSGYNGFGSTPALTGKGAVQETPGAGGFPAGADGVLGTGGGYVNPTFGGGGGGGLAGAGGGGGLSAYPANTFSGAGGGGSGGFPTVCTLIEPINVNYGDASYNTTKNPNLFTNGNGYIIITPIQVCEGRGCDIRREYRYVNFGTARAIDRFRRLNRSFAGVRGAFDQ